MSRDIWNVISDLENCVLKVRESRDTKGVHVPYHGPFASAVPSVLKDLDQLVKDLRNSLTAEEETDDEPLVSISIREYKELQELAQMYKDLCN